MFDQRSNNQLPWQQMTLVTTISDYNDPEKNGKVRQIRDHRKKKIGIGTLCSPSPCPARITLAFMIEAIFKRKILFSV